MFEYNSIVAGEPIEVFNFDFSSQLQQRSTRVKDVLDGVNALVFWVEYDWQINGRELKTSNGLIRPSEIGKPPKWHPGHRQGVYFISKSEGTVKEIEVKVIPGEVDLGFEFENVVVKV